MRVRRGLLFWGLFLIPLGGMTLLVRAGFLNADHLADAWRLWPLILIAIGVAVLASRGRAAIVGTVAMALLLGSLAGATLAGGRVWIGTVTDCAIVAGPLDQHLDRVGTLGSGSTATFDIRCGTLTIRPAVAAEWHVRAAYGGSPPIVEASATRLNVRVPGAGGVRRDAWIVDLPETAMSRLVVTANAASSTIDLGTMRLDRLDATLNAGDLTIDAGAAAVGQLDAAVNAGRIRATLGSQSVVGDLSVNAGAIDLCVPVDVGLRISVTDQLTFSHNLGARGLVNTGHVWTRSAPAGAQIVDLAVDGNAASLTLNPDGGCR